MGPNFYAQLDSNNKVIAVSQLSGPVNQSNLIPITPDQFAGNLLVATYSNGQFSGFCSKLNYDSASKKVTATIYDYMNIEQTSYANPISFNVDGSTSNITPINGVATLDVSILTAGPHTIKTTNSDLANGNITITI